MPQIKVDLKWLEYGDFMLRGGDFDDTYDPEDPFVYELQQLMFRLQISFNECITESNEIAAGLESYFGETVSTDLVDTMRKRIKHAIVYYPFLDVNTKLDVIGEVHDYDSIVFYIRMKNPAYETKFINVYANINSEEVIVFQEETT